MRIISVIFSLVLLSAVDRGFAHELMSPNDRKALAAITASAKQLSSNSQIPPPEFLPELHLPSYRAKTIPFVKDLVNASDRDVYIGLEGLPGNLPEDALRSRIIGILKLRDDIRSKILDGSTFQLGAGKKLMAPSALAQRLDSMIAQIPFRDRQDELMANASALREILTSSQLLQSIIFLNLVAAEPEVAAPGLIGSYYQIFKDNPKAHFFGLEQGTHYRSDATFSVIRPGTDLTALANLEESVNRAKINSSKIKQAYSQADVRPIVEPLNDIAAEIDAWKKKVARKWSSESRKSLNELSAQRSKDWVTSYYQLLARNNNRGTPFRVLIVGGMDHQPSLISEFKARGINLHILDLPTGTK